MGFIVCTFTSSKYNCFFGWLFMCFDGWTAMPALVTHIYLLLSIFLGKLPLLMQYFSVISAVAHLSVFVFLVILDFCFKSDTMFVVGQSESTGGNMTTTTTFGSIETNKNIQLEEEEESCFDDNPWALYRKHYFVTGFKIVSVILDIVVLCVFNDGWKCSENYYKC